MNLEDYRVIFLLATLGLSLVAVYPTLALIVPPVGSEEFSELWLLDAENMTDSYPFVVGESGDYTVFVGVSNRMSSSEYYRIDVKFRNSTQSVPDVNNSEPSVLFPLFEYQFFIDSNKSWQSKVDFSFDDVVYVDNVMSVGFITVNGMRFPVDSFVRWDPEAQGFFYQLFFELWRYDFESGQFVFDDRFVGLWLKMTIQ